MTRTRSWWTAAALTLAGCASGARPTPRSTARPAALPAALRAPPAPPRQASAAALTPDESLLLVADEDNDALVVLDAASLVVRSTARTGDAPVAAAALDDGRVLVVERGDGAVSEWRLRADAALVFVRRVPVAPDPVALAVAPGAEAVYVASGAASALTALDGATLALRYALPLAREPRGLAVAPDGRTLYAGHLVGGLVSVVDLPGRRVRGLLHLPPAPAHDPPGALDGPPSPGASARRSRGERPSRSARVAFEMAFVPPRHLRRDASPLARALTLSRDGARLYVAHVAVATGRALPPNERTGGYGAGGGVVVPAPLATVSVYDIVAGRWVIPPAGSRAGGPGEAFVREPVALALRGRDDALLVLGRGTGTLAVTDASDPDPALARGRVSLPDCDGAAGVAVRADGTTFVYCQFSHRVVVLDGDARRDARDVGADPLSPALALGRRLYHRTEDPRISRLGFSCATCHPDGRDDGNAWSLDGGLRQTPFLAGRLADTAPYNWLGQSPTLAHNLDQTMARIGGSALPPDDRDALAQWIVHGLRAPVAAREARTPDAARGEAVFAAAGCADCHDPGRGYADGRRHDVQSVAAGEPAVLFDTPSLRFVGLTAPYFHDGRYATLEDLLQHNGDRMGDTRALRPGALADLAAFLRTL